MGPPGQPGGVSRTAVEEQIGSLLVRHSQSDIIPPCPYRWNKLWDGYSLLFLEGTSNVALRSSQTEIPLQHHSFRENEFDEFIQGE